MANAISKLSVLLGLNSAEFTNGLKKAGDQLDKFDDKVRRGGGKKPFNFGAMGNKFAGMGGRGMAAAFGGGMGGALGGMGGLAGGGLGAVLGGLAGGPAGAMVGAGIGGSIGTAIGQVFQSSANPETMKKFNDVLADMAGVVGQRLSPLIDLAADGFRFFADVLHTILPSGEAFRAVLAPIKQVFEATRPSIEIIASLVGGALTLNLKVFAFALQTWADAVTGIVNFILDMARKVASAIPKFMRSKEHQAFIDGGPINLLKSSKGAGWKDMDKSEKEKEQGATFSSGEDLWRKNVLAATNAPETQIPSLLQMALEQLKAIKERLPADGGLAQQTLRDAAARALEAAPI